MIFRGFYLDPESILVKRNQNYALPVVASACFLYPSG
jgi:hypothetical protein